ncbi:MAG TPA: AI-2E family transporter [Armatimonadota bacterium]|jgi:predicted PurR-regulated permease PerM
MNLLETALLLTLTIAVIMLAIGEVALLRRLTRREGLDRYNWRELAVGVVLVFLAASLLWRVRGALPPFIIAAVLAIILNPLILRIEKDGWPRARAVIAVFLVFFALTSAMLLTLVPIIIDQTSDLVGSFPGYYKAANQQVERISKNRLNKLPDSIRTPISQQLQKVAGLVPAALSVGMSFLIDQFSKVLWLILIPISTLYFLLDLPRIQASLLKLVPIRQRTAVREVAAEVSLVFGHYLRGLVAVSAANGMVTAVVLTVLHIRYSWALGALAALLYPVPYIGALTSTTLAACIAYFQQEPYSLGRALTAAVSMVIINQGIFDNVVWPRVVGGHVGLHPLISVFSMVVAGELWGVMGVVVAVPLAKSLLVVLSRIYPRLIPPDEGLEADRQEAREEVDTLSREGEAQAAKSAAESQAAST